MEYDKFDPLKTHLFAAQRDT